ncbi:alpha/beta fold hydrolase [Mycobacterium aquaticum]|uniref:Alpha/beta hydrolase n=1 Tax=Mycobacterium aquaticum TaxID=1927124 RepID=A0A1X0ADS0_9MYCO|nr:alpha/beta hydrolase [Mycobacterium aquaticum]ORA28189.1 alpha/beta hydrolase [Mycobacterium aquaticum]
MASSHRDVHWQETTLTDGRVVAWHRRGSGPPVVLCHGTPWSSVVWHQIADDLDHSRTVYLWDMPGFGRSSMVGGQDVSIAAQIRALTELLDVWDLERPAVIAHDVGGAVALGAHLLHRRAMERLVLVDIVTLRPWGSPFFRLVRDHADVFMQLPPALHEGLVRAYIRGASYRELDAPTQELLVAPWLSAVGQQAFYAQIAQCRTQDTEPIVDRLAEVTTPTTILWGNEDAWIPAEQASRLAASIPDAKFTLVPEAGHLVHYDAPDLLARQIQAALMQHDDEKH